MEYSQSDITQTTNNIIGKFERGSAKVVQFATDATRLLSQTEESYQSLKNTGFFQRVSTLFKKNQSQLPVVQQSAVIQSEISKEEFNALQEFARQSLEALNERNLLTADALITVKNNLNTLDVKQQEIKEVVIQMAQKVSDRFNRLENRVDLIEDCQNLMLWVDGIEYDDAYMQLPETIRFLKIIKDYYLRKSDKYDREHLLLVRKALNSSGLDYKKEISLGDMVDSLVDELETFDEGRYLEITKIQLRAKETIDNDKLSNLLAVPSFNALCQMPSSKNRLEDTVSLFVNEYKIPYAEALKKAVRNDIARRNGINMDVKISLSDLGIELISCYSAIPDLVEDLKPKVCKNCGKEIKFEELPGCPYCGSNWRTDQKNN